MTVLVALAALAQNATWVGPGTSMQDATNWSGGASPTGTAVFAGNAPLNPIIIRPASTPAL